GSECNGICGLYAEHITIRRLRRMTLVVHVDPERDAPEDGSLDPRSLQAQRHSYRVRIWPDAATLGTEGECEDRLEAAEPALRQSHGRTSHSCSCRPAARSLSTPAPRV